jgi:hypothetical protein
VITLFKTRVLLTSAPGAFFKNSILRNYSLEKSNSSISNALNAQTFIKTYPLKFLENAPGALVSISLKTMVEILC